MAKNSFFQSPTLGQVSLPEVVERIRSYIDEDTERQHQVIIGSDSSPADHGVAEFVTAIVVHRVGRGGIYFWRRTTQDKIHTLRDRMYHEAICSLKLAQQLVEDGLLFPGEEHSSDLLEIHIDIGENGPTRQMIKEIVGMVTGSGFRVRTKPAAFAANKVADRYT